MAEDDPHPQNRAAFRILKFAAISTLVLSALVTCSYLGDSDKYAFEKEGFALGSKLPGSRLIASYKGGSLDSPSSWLWPYTYTFVYAIPDVISLGNFLQISLYWDDKSNSGKFSNSYIQVFCKEGQIWTYYADKNVDGPIARNAFGEEIKTTDGIPYRLISETKLDKNNVLCTADWSKNVAAIRASIPASR